MARQTIEDEAIEQVGAARYGPLMQLSDPEVRRRSSRRERDIDDHPARVAWYAGVTDVRSRVIADRNVETCNE